MDYFEVGTFLGIIVSITFLVTTLRNRRFESSFLEDVIRWWDGNVLGFDLVGVFIGVFTLALMTLAIHLLIVVGWLIIIPCYCVGFVIVKIRNRRISKLKKAAVEKTYGKK
jgi:hypothetical protein